MRRLGIIRTFAAALVACGCAGGDELLGIRTPLTLEFSVSTVAAGHTIQVNGTQRYACTYKFTVKASGNNSVDLAGFTDADINFRLTSNGAASTSTLFSTDLQDWFGTSKVYPGNTLTTGNKDLYSSGPFTASILFRYLITNSDKQTVDSKTATINLAC